MQMQPKFKELESFVAQLPAGTSFVLGAKPILVEFKFVAQKIQTAVPRCRDFIEKHSNYEEKIRNFLQNSENFEKNFNEFEEKIRKNSEKIQLKSNFQVK